MIERIVNLDYEVAYDELRKLLLRNNCKIVQEERPAFLSVKQGSLRGVSPGTAEKIIDFHLSPRNAETKMVASSRISPNWTNLTLYGNLMAALLVGIFWWIALDIEAYAKLGIKGPWNWLAGAYGYPNFQVISVMINLTKIMAIVLACAILLEIIIVIYVYPRVDTFAEQSLKKLP